MNRAAAGLPRVPLGRLRTTWHRVESFAGTRASAVLCFVAALAVFGIQSIAWPLRGGRDSTTYLMYYLDMWHARPALPELMLFRTPLTGLVFGPLLQLGGASLAEAGMAVAYAVSVLAFAAAALSFGRRCALVTAVALLLYPAYGALFHQVSSDSVFALVVALWTLGVVRAMFVPATWKFALLGLGLVALVLARPSSQVLLVFAAVPLILTPASWRRRFTWSGAYLAVAIGLLAGYAGYNDLRYADFTVARGSSATVPFYRVFVLEHIVKPQNGPASRSLARAVQRELLTQQPYRAERIGLDQFFTLEGDREWGDLVVLSDHVWGWNSDYSILRRVAFEAIARHPKLYIRDIIDSTRFELVAPYTSPVSVRPSRPTPQSGATASAGADTSNADPGGYLWWLASTPDGHITQERDSAGRQLSMVWRDPRDQAHVATLNANVARLQADLPNRDGSPTVARALNRLSQLYPRMAVWLAVGVVALLVRWPRGTRVLLVLAAISLLVIVGTLLAMPTALEYRVPFDPIFVLLGVAALTGTSRSTRLHA